MPEARELFARVGRGGARADRGAVPRAERPGAAGAGRVGHPARAPHRVHARGTGVGGALLRAGSAAAADADRPRSRPSVPAGGEQEPQLRDRVDGAGRLRTRHRDRDREGAARGAAHHQAAARGERQRACVRDAVVRAPRAPARAVPRPHRRELLAVPRDARRRPLDRRGGGEEPARGAAGGVAAAAVRLGGTARGGGGMPRASRPVPAAAVRADGSRPLSLRRPGQHRAPVVADRPGGRRRAQVRRLCAGTAGAPARRARHPGRDPPARHPAAPSVPGVRAGRRVHPPGRRRSGRGGDQADGVSHRRQFGADGGADRGGQARQGSHRRRRADGALRRGGQHQLGGAARARGGAGRVRRVRLEDAREARAAHPPRERSAGRLAPRSVRAPGHRATIIRAPPACTPTSAS